MARDVIKMKYLTLLVCCDYIRQMANLYGMFTYHVSFVPEDLFIESIEEQTQRIFFATI